MLNNILGYNSNQKIKQSKYHIVFYATVLNSQEYILHGNLKMALSTATALV